ncbi:hypothetical protein [Cytobacillus oceanisediminis]|uniref:hypothetical protein n=1 Tax=Cytobacillus oceanisediminis TaxID=665099 RepID=UPI001FB35051|nr:hypothetical protein [Cytobacillus oceanisediminis]UOE58141.1 hypothetical protein IRB79_26920 [Cytobacillus oceanisediminis]
MRVLECSSKGDIRFSAFGAWVEVFGKMDKIENHYQLCKRFNGVAPKHWSNAKGKKPTSIVLNGLELDVRFLSPFYKLMWVKYLDGNPDLVQYAKHFDEFNDFFRGRSVNCQADVIRQYVKEGRSSIIAECEELMGLLWKNQKPNP